MRRWYTVGTKAILLLDSLRPLLLLYILLLLYCFPNLHGIHDNAIEVEDVSLGLSSTH